MKTLTLILSLIVSFNGFALNSSPSSKKKTEIYSAEDNQMLTDELSLNHSASIQAGARNESSISEYPQKILSIQSTLQFGLVNESITENITDTKSSLNRQSETGIGIKANFDLGLTVDFYTALNWSNKTLKLDNANTINGQNIGIAFGIQAPRGCRFCFESHIGTAYKNLANIDSGELNFDASFVKALGAEIAYRFYSQNLSFGPSLSSEIANYSANTFASGADSFKICTGVGLQNEANSGWLVGLNYCNENIVSQFRSQFVLSNESSSMDADYAQQTNRNESFALRLGYQF